MSFYKYNLSFITILLCLSHFHAQSQTIQWTDNPGKTFVFEINNDEAEKLIQSAAKDSLFQKMLHRPAGSFSGEWKDCPGKDILFSPTSTGTKSITGMFP